MHSTVQSGFFSQYNPDYSHSSSHYHPPFHSYHQSPQTLHHIHHSNQSHNHETAKSHTNHHGASSVNVSLLAINVSSENIRNDLNQSITNINKIKDELSASTSNIVKKRNSLGSTESTPPQVNTSFNYLVTKGAHEAQNNSKNQQDLYNKGSKNSIESFWQCTKPCGILTIFIGVLLLICSVFGFILFLEQNICSSFKTCSSPLVKILTITSLVIGIVLTFLGSVIVIYVKKDKYADIIITSSKHISIDQSEIKKKQEIKNTNLSAVAIKTNSNSSHMNTQECNRYSESEFFEVQSAALLPDGDNIDSNQLKKNEMNI